MNWILEGEPKLIVKDGKISKDLLDRENMTDYHRDRFLGPGKYLNPLKMKRRNPSECSEIVSCSSKIP